MSTFDLLRHLREQVKKYGSQRKLAKALGISAAYLGDVLSGKREAGPSILDPLGLKRTVIIEKKVRYERQ